MAPKPQEHLLDADAASVASIACIDSAPEEEERQREDAKMSASTQQPSGSSIADGVPMTGSSEKHKPRLLLSPEGGAPPAEDSSGGGAVGYYYLTPEAAASLPNFRYDGSDLSLIYKHVLSPLAQYLVDHWTPDWAAPNAITLLGLCWMVTSYSLIWYHCPNTMDEALVSVSSSDTDSPAVPVVPRWIFAFNALAMLIYQTLDNMDGKQSRRTGSSSPLGLLFDHGCDAVNSIFGSANWICAMGLSTMTDRWQIWILVVCPMVAFYVTTWEEYYTHKLVLPVFNGPTEGLLMGAALFATSAIWGVEYWHGTTWFDSVLPYLPSSIVDLVPSGGTMRNADVVAVMTVLAMVREISGKVWSVSRRYGPSSTSGLVPMTSIAVLAFAVGYADPTVLVRHPRSSLHLIAALFVESVTQLMLDHMTGTTFRPLRPVLVLPALYSGLVWSGAVEGRIADDLLLSYTAGLCVYLAMKFGVVIHEFCDVLGIWCFDIVTPHPKAEARRRKAKEA